MKLLNSFVNSIMHALLATQEFPWSFNLPKYVWRQKHSTFLNLSTIVSFTSCDLYCRQDWIMVRRIAQQNRWSINVICGYTLVIGLWANKLNRSKFLTLSTLARLCSTTEHQIKGYILMRLSLFMWLMNMHLEFIP